MLLILKTAFFIFRFLEAFKDELTAVPRIVRLAWDGRVVVCLPVPGRPDSGRSNEKDAA